MISRRNLRAWGYVVAGFGGGWLILQAAFHALGRPAPGPHPFDPTRGEVMTASYVIAAIWLVVFCAMGYRSADEFAQQGSRVALYWGGIAGLAASLPLHGLLVLTGHQFLFTGAPTDVLVSRAYVIGYFQPVIMQFLGVAVVWIWWRVSRR